VVEGNGLENRRASNGTEGSNPSLSAIENTPKIWGYFLWRMWILGFCEAKRSSHPRQLREQSYQ
jgi:hypothetical protein